METKLKEFVPQYYQKIVKDYSLSYDGGEVVNGEKLVSRMESKVRDAIPLIQAAIDNIEYNIKEGGFALEGEQELLNKLKEWVDE
jgi:hypothetical protein